MPRLTFYSSGMDTGYEIRNLAILTDEEIQQALSVPAIVAKGPHYKVTYPLVYESLEEGKRFAVPMGAIVMSKDAAERALAKLKKAIKKVDGLNKATLKVFKKAYPIGSKVWLLSDYEFGTLEGLETLHAGDEGKVTYHQELEDCLRITVQMSKGGAVFIEPLQVIETLFTTKPLLDRWQRLRENL